MGEGACGVPRGGAWGVGALLLAARDAMAARFGAVVVRGELGSFTRAASGHCYFSLKDADGAPALLRCAMFRRAASMLDFGPADGQQVELRGRLEVYEARGELQLVVEAMQRVGAGSLYEQFLRLRNKLAAEGLFDAGRKRTPSREPRVLGVITSLGAAGLHDVLTALARRAPHVAVVVYPTPVQGAEAPAAIVRALAEANRRAEADTLLVVRGGGSLEDLWSFNDERVVRAVVDSALPVVCGVGHETDITLADLAADVRAPTPTAAAELASPAREELLTAVAARQQALGKALERALQSRAQRLDRLALKLGAPAAEVAAQRQRWQGLQLRLQRAMQRQWPQRDQTLLQLAQRLQRVAPRQLQSQELMLEASARRLQALDPQRVLQRGYAWVENEAGRAVTSIVGLQPGQAVRAVWADGSAHATIDRLVPRPDPER